MRFTQSSSGLIILLTYAYLANFNLSIDNY